jgi:A/G-specific adenine glycosylase
MPHKPSRSKRKGESAARLLAWYDQNRRALPWRALPGETADPYRVWLSEIMLQQTTVAAVDKYFRKFVARWSDVGALAAASLDDVRAAWAGLGYYSRAANLHRTARIVAGEHAGRFPSDAAGLRKLPGIGDYTAGAIAAIAFGAREAAVDGKPELRRLVRTLVPENRAGDFAQGLMDLGALICTPRRPACTKCPWTRDCRGRASGHPESFPVKSAERARPLKRGAAFVARDAEGAVLLVKRAERGLLGGMLQPPLGPWGETFPDADEVLAQAPFRGEWKHRAGVVRHGFTHFELEIEVYHTELNRRGDVEGIWVAAHDLGRVALPTVMRKIIVHALGG